MRGCIRNQLGDNQQGDKRVSENDIYNKIGCLRVEELEGFVASSNWRCQHCGSNGFAVEEYSDTGWCAVSATPYIAFDEDEKHFAEKAVGFPAYTVICTGCFATTRYHAIRVVEAIEAGAREKGKTKIIEAT